MVASLSSLFASSTSDRLLEKLKTRTPPGTPKKTRQEMLFFSPEGHKRSNWPGGGRRQQPPHARRLRGLLQQLEDADSAGRAWAGGLGSRRAGLSHPAGGENRAACVAETHLRSGRERAPSPRRGGARGQPALLPPPSTVKAPSRFLSGGASGPREEPKLSPPAVAPRTSSVSGRSDRPASPPDPAVLRSPQPAPGHGRRPERALDAPPGWGSKGQGGPSAGHEGSMKNPIG